MCDFAPRNSYDFAAAVREATIACAGLFTPTPAIVGETVCLITDPPTCPHGGASSAPAQSPSPASAGAAAVSSSPKLCCQSNGLIAWSAEICIDFGNCDGAGGRGWRNSSMTGKGAR